MRESAVQGVPAYGLIDSGADITIIGGNLIKKVATVAKLRKCDFMKAPRTYDQRPFQLDGRMDLDISFDDSTMTKPVHVKMDAQDQLLLSEGVCRQLGRLQYHQSVERWRRGKRRPAHSDSGSASEHTTNPGGPPTSTESTSDQTNGAKVPTIRVNLLQSTHVLPHLSKVVEVAVISKDHTDGPYLLDPTPLDCGLYVDPSLLQVEPDHIAVMVLSNPTGCSMSLAEDVCWEKPSPLQLCNRLQMYSNRT